MPFSSFFFLPAPARHALRLLRNTTSQALRASRAGHNLWLSSLLHLSVATDWIKAFGMDGSRWETKPENTSKTTHILPHSSSNLAY